MNKIYFIVLISLSLFSSFVYAQTETIDNCQINQDSIGFVKIGTPLSDVKKLASQLGYTIKQSSLNYIVYDKQNLPLITFTVFESKIQTKPVRSIKTTSSNFTFNNGVSMVDSSINKLLEIYPSVLILRVSSNPVTPEFIDFKGWPFSDSVVKDKYIIKFQALLNKVVDEYGKPKQVGIYPSDFSLYTDKYLPEAKIESFQIEAIEPKVRLEDQKEKSKR